MLVASFEKAERYYHVYKQPTLFGNEIDLVCVWGTFDSNRNEQKIVICQDTDDVQLKLASIIKRRKSRKYLQNYLARESCLWEV